MVELSHGSNNITNSSCRLCPEPFCRLGFTDMGRFGGRSNNNMKSNSLIVIFFKKGFSGWLAGRCSTSVREIYGIFFLLNGKKKTSTTRKFFFLNRVLHSGIFIPFTKVWLGIRISAGNRNICFCDYLGWRRFLYRNWTREQVMPATLLKFDKVLGTTNPWHKMVQLFF